MKLRILLVISILTGAVFSQNLKLPYTRQDIAKMSHSEKLSIYKDEKKAQLQ